MKRKFFDFFRLILKTPFLERYLVLLTKGKPFGSFITKFPPNHYQYKVGTIRFAERDGINYKLDISDVIDWFIYFGFWEESRYSLYDLMKEGQTIFDIGTNVGDVALHAAKLVGEMGEIHCFEPDPRNYIRLDINLRLNKFTNIVSNQVGLGHEAGSFKIEVVESGNLGMNRIVSNELDHKDYRLVEIITLDSYVLETNMENIDLVKIDVEGFEYNVLKGSVNVVEKYHPVFFIELDNNNLLGQEGSARQLILFLEKHGYDIIHAENHQPITSKTNFDNCHYDIIAKYNGS